MSELSITARSVGFFFSVGWDFFLFLTVEAVDKRP